LTSGGSVSGKDFANWTTGSVSGTKHEDKNADGSPAGDPGKSGFTIYVDYNNNKALDSGEPSAVTAADGTYSITGVKPGSWNVREVGQTGWTCSYPNPGGTAPKTSTDCAQPLTMTSSGSVSGKDFANWTTGTATGMKFNAADAAHPGLAGWTVRAYVDTNGDGTLQSTETTVGATATTGTGGTYSLALNPGTKYVVCEVTQSNWLQLSPSNALCANAPSGVAPGGYAVSVTSSGTVGGNDFGNVPFNSTSTMTDSSFQLADDLTPWTISDFEILLNSSNTIVATNPGQFYYHQRAVNTSGGSASMQFTIKWPCQFTTQTVGGQPIHAYVQYAGDSANTWRDFTGTATGITWNNGPVASCDKNTTAGPQGTGTITVNGVPANAKVWVTVHLDYALKGLTAPSSTFGTPPINYTPFTSTIVVGASGSSVSSTSLLGRGKKVTVVYGTLTDSGGNPLAGVWVRATQGTNTAIGQTGGDGQYIFYDGESCTTASFITSCSGASATTWNFAKGTSSVKIDILGDGATAAASPTYPTGKTSATVKSGSTSYATLTAPNGYSFNVANGSAYNRDWRFGP
jgi:hypothetical protein